MPPKSSAAAPPHVKTMNEQPPTLSINGTPYQGPPGLSLAEVLRHVGIDPAQPGIAVAVDGRVVPRARWTETRMEAPAEIEVLTAAQGG